MIYNLLPKFRMRGFYFSQSDCQMRWPFDTSNKINHIRDWGGWFFLSIRRL